MVHDQEITGCGKYTCDKKIVNHLRLSEKEWSIPEALLGPDKYLHCLNANTKLILKDLH